MVDTARTTFSFKVPRTLRGWSSKGNCIYAEPPLERLTGLNSDQISQADWRSFLTITTLKQSVNWAG